MQGEKLPVASFSPTPITSFNKSERLLHFSYEALRKVARYFVPPYDERTPITASNALYSALPPLCLFLMAGLARRSGTWLLRLALLPVTLALTVRMSFGHFIDGENFHGFNHGIGELTLCSIDSETP